MIRTLLLAMMTLCTTTSFASLPDWQEMMSNPKYKKAPTKDALHKKLSSTNVDGYQLFQVADRFGFLFDPDGYPVVAFDFTLEPLTMKDQLLGSVGIGGWSLRSLFKKYKQASDKPAEVFSMAEGSSDTGKYGNLSFSESMDAFKAEHITTSDKEIKNGIEKFGKLEFTDDWMNRHGFASFAVSGKRSGFAPASFTMADLYLDQSKEELLHSFMVKFAKLVDGSDLDKKDLAQYMSQFRMDWNPSKAEFNIVWSPKDMKMSAAKQPLLPGWVANYANPMDILQYKYNIESTANMYSALIEIKLGFYGTVLGILISRVLDGIVARMNYHEDQLQAVMEAALRGEYEVNIPMENLQEFMDLTVTMLYLNKLPNVDPRKVDPTDGDAKRAYSNEYEAKNREDVLKWLAKKKYDVKAWQDNRTATVFKDGKRKGIVNLVTKREFFTRQPSWHFYDQFGWYKTFNRVGLEIFTDAFRLSVSDYVKIQDWIAKFIHVGFSYFIPTFFWDGVFRGRSFNEIGYEGFVSMKVSEAGAGRWKDVPGYDNSELAALRGTLSTQRVNTFEVPAKYEDTAIANNLKVVTDIITGGTVKDFKYVKP